MAKSLTHLTTHCTQARLAFVLKWNHSLAGWVNAGVMRLRIMSVLGTQLANTLLPGMFLPAEFSALFDWIESNNLYIDNEDRRIGFLCPNEILKTGSPETDQRCGTEIYFMADVYIRTRSWPMNRICTFARTGGDGSEAAFWIDDSGKQRIVHMGSGSGSMLTCVLADNALDFLRLIAIGYEEICWNDRFPYPPNSPELGGGLFVHPNLDYQKWVTQTFNTVIPKCALEIVRNPAEMGDSNTLDDFCRWLNKNAA